MKFLCKLASVLPILTTCSCVLPYPHKRYSQEDFSGSVIDGNSGAPLANADVVVGYETMGSNSGSSSTTSSSDGQFRIKGEYTRHWAVLLSPISMSLLPTKAGPVITKTVRSVTVSKAGYRKIRYDQPAPKIEFVLHSLK